VDEPTRAAKEAAVVIQRAQDVAGTSNDTRSLAISSHSEPYSLEGELAFQTFHELESNRTLGFGLPGTPSSKLRPWLSSTGYCAWKQSPLRCTFETYEDGAMYNLECGRSPSERIPLLILTDELGANYDLLEVREVLSEEEIIAFIQCRADAKKQSEEKQAKSGYDRWSKAERESLNAAERLATGTARAWWDVEQKERDRTYKGWKYEAAKERALLVQHIQQEVDEYFERLAKENAAEEEEGCSKHNRMEQIKYLAKLMVKMERDGLRPRHNGLWTSDDYSVKFTDKVFNTFLSRRDDIETKVRDLATSEETFEKRLAAQERQEELRKINLENFDRLWQIVEERREFEMKMRRLDVFDEREQEWDMDYDVPKYKHFYQHLRRRLT
jgi:hypothetical protein